MYLGESQSRFTRLAGGEVTNATSPPEGGWSGRRPADALSDRLDQVELQQKAVELVCTTQRARHGLPDLSGITHLQPLIAIFDLLDDREDVSALTPGIDPFGGAGHDVADQALSCNVADERRDDCSEDDDHELVS